MLTIYGNTSKFFEFTVPKQLAFDIYSKSWCRATKPFCCFPAALYIKRLAKQMEEQKKLAKRICFLCQRQGISYYTLSYRSAVPMTTLMHIIDGSTKNPGLFTIVKICNGLNMTVKDFFDAEEFIGIEDEAE